MRWTVAGHLRWAILAVALAIFCALPLRPAAGEDFRVDTQVFQESQEQPVSKNVTRFHGQQIWDFAGDGSEIIMFDRSRRKFALLDPVRKVRTALSAESVMQFSLQLRDWAGAQNDPLLRFCAWPKLERSAGQEPGSLVFTGSLLTYRVTADKAPKPEFAASYREFSDWYARLNVIFHPGTLPPFARLVVNEQLGRDQLIPREVRLNISPQRRFGNREFALRSTHDIRYGLTATDLAEIDTASRYKVTFRAVSLDAYRRHDPDKPAEANTARAH